MRVVLLLLVVLIGIVDHGYDGGLGWTTIFVVNGHKVGGMNHEDALREDELRQMDGFVNLDAKGIGEDEFEVEFRMAGPLGIQFDQNLKIMQFVPVESGRMGPAEKSGLLTIGDRLIMVNGDEVEFLSASDAFQVLNEAAEASEKSGFPRNFRFRRGEGTNQHRDLSDQVKSKREGHMEHLDVFGFENEEGDEDLLIHVLLSENIGIIPETCGRKKLVFVTPDDGCNIDKIETNPSVLGNALAVVRRGKCSFYDKGSVLSNFNVSGVIVINDEDRLFRMKMDGYRDNDLTIPMALISVFDGDRLFHLQERNAHDFGKHLEARLIASEKCFELEKREAEKADEDSKNALGSPSDEHIPWTNKHRLYGVLAPSGYVRVFDGPSYDFLSASFSGPLPVDIELRVHEQIQPRHVTHPYGVLVDVRIDDEAQLFNKLLQIQTVSSTSVAIIASPGTSIFHLEGPLPSPIKIAVIMVSKQSFLALKQFAHSFQKIYLEPAHDVKHRWLELQQLQDPKAWPKDEKTRKRLIARLERTGNQFSTTCWNDHFQTIKQKQMQMHQHEEL